MSSADFITGLQSAIGAYATASDKKAEREQRKKEQELEYRAKGFIPEFDEKGNITGLIKDPAIEQQNLAEKEKEEQLGLLKAGLIPAGMDPEKIPQVNTKLYQARAAANPLNALAPGQKASDTAFGKEYADYSAGGGAAGVAKNIGLLKGATNKLKENKGLSGGVSGYLGESAQDLFNPKGAAVRDDIRSAIQSTLKQTLGGQFTEREAQAMFSRAYNPRLSDEENARRATAIMGELEQIAAQKDAAAKYFEQSGTLKGFQGAKAGGLMQQSSQPQAKPQTIKQNGVTYTLNPQTGEYE